MIDINLQFFMTIHPHGVLDNKNHRKSSQSQKKSFIVVLIQKHVSA